MTLPSAPPRASQLRRHAKLVLDASGLLSGDVEEVRSGDLAAQLRDRGGKPRLREDRRRGAQHRGVRRKR